MSKLRFSDSSILLRIIQRCIRLDAPLSIAGPVPTTPILLMFVFTQLTGIEDLLCAGDSTRSCGKGIRLSKISSSFQRTWWLQRRSLLQRGIEIIQEIRRRGGREVTGRRGTHSQTQPVLLFFPSLGKTLAEVWFCIHRMEIDTSVNSPNQIAFTYQAVSAHWQGENL